MKFLALAGAASASQLALLFQQNDIAQFQNMQHMPLIAPEAQLQNLDANCDASSMIKQHEGVRKCVYTDTMGYKTIGVGFNLDQSGARQTCQNLGIDYDAIYNGS